MGKQQRSGWLTTLFSIFFVLTSQFISPLVEAQDLMVIPRVTAGIMDYEYELGGVGETSLIQDKTKLNKELPFLGVGATLVYDKWAVDAYYQTTNTMDIDDSGTFPVVGTSEVSYTRNTELKRQDFALTAGYSLLRNWSLSFGYKYGDTSYDWTDQERDGKGGNVGTAFKENNFVAKGPFIGIGYNLPLWKGVLAFNVAAALLEGEITTSRVHEPGGSEVKLSYRERNELVKASATGLTLGVNWNQPITERLSYSILLQGFKYDFDASRGVFRDSLISDKVHEILNLDAFDVEETVYSINMSLNYRF
ncbi:MAG TPA: hypothetical protein ENG03_07110 [Thioploca sp.]|nr:hypothetical protein [Thioploca sp.]